jgi:7-cyano-7-deazaguanine synthase
MIGGGIDSAALIAFYISRKANISAIHLNYGQPSFNGEHRSAIKLSKFYNIPLNTINLGLSIVNTQGEYNCRNATLLLAAASSLPAKERIFSLGIHSGTSYYDCSPKFIEDIQQVLDGYYGGIVQIEAPFLQFTKKDIVKFCRIKKVPIDITFSCECRSDLPCRGCPSCIEREAILNESG